MGNSLESNHHFQAVVLAGVAVRHQHVHAGRHRAVDDRLQRAGRDGVVGVEGRDEDAGNAVEGGAQEIGAKGIDGLIASMSQRNQTNSASGAKS